MGSASSKAATTESATAQATGIEKSSREAENISSLRNLSLLDAPVSQDGSLTLSQLEDWESTLAQDSKLLLARTILTHSDITSTLLKIRQATISDPHVFNTSVDFNTNPITSQKSSGRCWLFATTNVVRYSIMKKLGLKEFQLSQVSHLVSKPWEKLMSVCRAICSSTISSRKPTITLNCQLSMPTSHLMIVKSFISLMRP